MCNCEAEIKAKLKELYPESACIGGQYELFSGRSYMEMEIKFLDKKKPTKTNLLHSFCPFCGVNYEIGEGKEDGR